MGCSKCRATWDDPRCNCEEEERQRQYDLAHEAYMREVREYRYCISEYFDAWVAYDYQLHANVKDIQEPVLVPAPIHPDDMEEAEVLDPDEEIPF